MIVVGVDLSPGSRHALAWAFAEAAFRRDRVLALHAGPPTSDLVAHTALVEQRHAATLARLTALLDERGGANAAAEVVDGHAATVLAGRSPGAALLVVGRRGLGAVASLLLGSVSHELVRHAACPVAVVPADPPVEVRRVVVGVDGSTCSDVAARWAGDEAATRHVPLVVVHSLPTAGMFEDAGDADRARRLVERTVAAVRRDGMDVVPYVTRDGAGQALVATAGHDDLLVVGTHGHGGAARLLLGSTAAYCLEHAAGTVVVVPARR